MKRSIAQLACAAAGLFVSNSGQFNSLRISARYLDSNSAESHGYI